MEDIQVKLKHNVQLDLGRVTWIQRQNIFLVLSHVTEPDRV